jgi:hypothetical protein
LSRVAVSPAVDAALANRVGESVEAALREGRPCLMCIAGNSGCGKSVLGKAIRKKGIGWVRPREILVIDDGVASVPFLGLFRRRVRFRTKEKDHLRPFERYFRGKKLVIFVNAQPARRLDECDLLVEVTCPEEQRRRHLLARNVDGAKRVSDTVAYRLLKPKSRAALAVENRGSVFATR